MEKSPLSVRIIYFLSSLSFYLMILVTAAVFVANILTQLDVLGDDFELRVDFPAKFDVEETGQMPIMGQVQDVRIEEAKGKIHIVETPKSFSRMTLRVLFVVVLIGLFITWKFKVFIQNIKEGNVFNNGNINNLKQVSYAIVLGWLAQIIYSEVFYHMSIKFIEFDSVHFYRDTQSNNAPLIIALGLWVLAHVFEKGKQIQDENTLTI